MADREKDFEEQRARGMDPAQRIWMFAMYIFHWACIGAAIMIIVAEGFVMENSLRRFTEQFGVGEAPARGYQNDQDYNPTCGYVQMTNVPKHLGSVVWSAGWQIFIIIAALIIIFADLALALPNNNNICWRIVKSLWLDGMTYDQKTAQADPYGQYGASGQTTPKPIPFFLGALAFFKVFLTFGFLSQSFYGLDTGEDPWGEKTGPDTQLFCLWAGFILAGSALTGLVSGAFLFLAKAPRELSDERYPYGLRNPRPAYPTSRYPRFPFNRY
uniref:Predicted protein n=1 Tax=Hordeum vulgare subsp. vulgare TaxID=112509 RepID=F2D177_HORVV|nr:predicted protein [Hordeum vulgare subsp. vulgare]